MPRRYIPEILLVGDQATMKMCEFTVQRFHNCDSATEGISIPRVIPQNNLKKSLIAVTPDIYLAVNLSAFKRSQSLLCCALQCVLWHSLLQYSTLLQPLQTSRESNTR
eukprot:GHUV01036850.1.p2 GENE.GHUV01036850.1~~GHUV01036850.1.p2  ORF type:complete len:108 (+),score=3.32 GHUV01036850.1:218-541(+)